MDGLLPLSGYDTKVRAPLELHVEWVDEEAVVLHPETGELHYLNPSAALVYALIQEFGYERGLEELIRSHPDAASDQEGLQRLIADMLERGLLVND
jgi:hypothetical protein